MKINKLLIMFMLFTIATTIFSSAFVSATDGVIYTINQPMDYKGFCNYNGTTCSSPQTSCNVTILYPNGNMFVDNKPMTNQNTFYNITLSPSLILGEYQSKMSCYDPVSSFSGSTDTTFIVTSTGTSGSGNMTIFILLLVSACIVLVISLVMGNLYIGFLSGILFILSGMYFNIYGIGIQSNMYTTALGMIIIGLGVTIFIICGYKSMVSDGENKESEDSEDKDDAFQYD